MKAGENQDVVAFDDEQQGKRKFSKPRSSDALEHWRKLVRIFGDPTYRAFYFSDEAPCQGGGMSGVPVRCLENLGPRGRAEGDLSH